MPLFHGFYNLDPLNIEEELNLPIEPPMDYQQSERAKTHFEFRFKKPYDGRYHYSLYLHNSATEQLKCLSCQGQWWRFWVEKSMICTDYQRKLASVMRRRNDPGYAKNEFSI